MLSEWNYISFKMFHHILVKFQPYMYEENPVEQHASIFLLASTSFGKKYDHFSLLCKQMDLSKKIEHC